MGTEISERVTLNVKLQWSGVQLNIQVKPTEQIGTIKTKLMGNAQLKIQQSDREGNSYSYYFLSKRHGKKLNDNDTIAKCNLVDGDKLIFTQVVVAG